MNRSILILICDFLLVSLLAFSSVDINKVADSAAPAPARPQMATNRADTTRDLAVVMRMALADERVERDKLLGELARTRENLGQQQTRASESERQTQAAREEIAARAQAERQLRQEQAGLLAQLATTRTNVAQLEGRVRLTAEEAGRLRQEAELARQEAERLRQEAERQAAEKAAEIKRRAEEALALQQRVDALSRTNQAVLAERQRLSTQLEVAQVEKQHATAQVVKMEEQVKVERQERAKLADNVQALAAKSGNLEREIRDNRPLNPNTIFSMMVSNRVRAHFGAERPTFLGIDSTRRRATATVLVAAGDGIYAIAHVSDTPFTFFNPGTDWHTLQGELGRNGRSTPIRALAFDATDPRIVLIPVTAADAAQLGVTPYRTADDPFKFPEAVIVGAQEGYYGEARFEIDINAPGYVKLDRGFLKGLFGQFNPSRGDLVFSKTGELLGVMANNSYCLVLKDFRTAATFQFAPDTRDQRTGLTLSQMYARILAMPARLQ